MHDQSYASEYLLSNVLAEFIGTYKFSFLFSK